MKLVVAILCLQFLIAFHELGHFLFARLFGMRVARFSVGFGPRLLGWTRGETTYQMAAVPFGGFVQIVGMSPEEGVEPNDPNIYPNKPMWQRFLVVLMGPVMNFVLAFAFLSWAFGAGVLDADPSRAAIGTVQPGSAAAAAGLSAGDEIVSINGQAIANFEALRSAVQASSSDAPLSIAFTRQGAPNAVLIPSAAFTQKPRMLGVSPATRLVKANGVGDALVLGAQATWQKSVSTFQTIAGIFTGHKGGKFVGLPGIVKIIGNEAASGVTALLLLLAVLSINLGLFNLLPLPALDGGRLIFLGYEGVSRRKANVRVETFVHTVGMVLLFGFILFVSVRDLIG
jgi:regulator of sigma E protease